MTITTSQVTLAAPVSFSGIGLHNGKECQITLHPAPENHGIQFVKDGHIIPALASSVLSTSFCVKLGLDSAHTIQTVEHLLCALMLNQISNVLCEVVGEEIPVMDGSATIFSQGIVKTGLKIQAAPRKVARITKTVEVQVGSSIAKMSPALDQSYHITLDYHHPALPEETLTRSFSLLKSESFAHIDRARTYGFTKDEPFYRAHGLAQGASVETALIFNDTSVENPEGMRSTDEITCHKILDCIGDLSLIGAPFLGHYEAQRPGHTLNVNMVRALFEQNAIVWETMDSALSLINQAEEAFV